MRVEKRSHRWERRGLGTWEGVWRTFFFQVALLPDSFLGISGWVKFTTRVSRWARLEELYKFSKIPMTRNNSCLFGHQQGLPTPVLWTFQAGAMTPVPLSIMLGSMRAVALAFTVKAR